MKISKELRELVKEYDSYNNLIDSEWDQDVVMKIAIQIANILALEIARGEYSMD